MPRRFWIALFALAPMSAGCFSFRSLPPEVDRPLWRPSDEIPPEQKNCVYTFVFGSVNLFDGGQAACLRDQLITMGFGKTYFGQAPHLSYFAGKMREIAAHCPPARFAIVGYAGGAIPAAELAVEARKAGISPDLLVFLEPSEFCHGCDETLARQVMTIRGDGGLLGITPASCGELVIAENAHRSAIPTHEVTIGVMERELTLIAMGVDIPGRIDPPKKPLVEPLPPPRKTIQRVRSLPAEWRFLEPYGGLGIGFSSGDAPAVINSETLPPPRVVEPKSAPVESPKQ